MELPIYKYEIDEFDDQSGMTIISLVDSPAMQLHAVKLAEQKPEAELVIFKATDVMKRNLTSAAIIPNKLIFREDKVRGKYNAYFSVEDAEKIHNKFMKQSGNLRLSNLNHDAGNVIDAFVTEAWIIADAENDKAVALGFKDLPVGTVMYTMHIPDEDVWNNEVMTGNVNGFSLEGLFHHTPVKLSEEKQEEEVDIYDILSDFLENNHDN